MKGVARWIGWYALLFVLLFAAGIAFGWMRSHYGPVYHWPWNAAAQVRALEGADRVLRADVAQLQRTARSRLSDGELRSRAAIDARLVTIEAERRRRAAEDARAGGIARQLLAGGAEAIVAAHRNRLALRRLEIEQAFLRRLRAPAATLEQLTDLEGSARIELARKRAQCDGLTGETNRLRSVWILRRLTIEGFRLRDRLTLTEQARAQVCASRDRLAIALVQAERRRLRLHSVLHNLPVAAGSYARETEDIAAALRERWLFAARTWVRAHRGAAWWAAFGVVSAILTPYLIRLLFFFVLAPRASRRPPLVLLPEAAPMGWQGGHSAVAQDIAVPPGWELLAKTPYLHRTPTGSRQRSRLFLSRRAPLASLLRGLTRMTLVRDPAGGSATLSAAHDPFAELLALRLEEGQAAMLLPRLIVAVLQPIDRPLRITRHWRLGSLHAWLTGQLRFLVFHGEAVLVLKGYRGLHVAAADHDIDLPQDHVVGFSANLAYGVVRSGTLQPYLLGYGHLLRDAVRAGPGVVVTEEAPGFATGKGHGARHRLEGALDVVLKLFGL